MRILSLFFCLCLASVSAFSQQLKMSTEVITPQQKKLEMPLHFPGVSGNTYYVNEYAGEGFFSGKDVSQEFDINTLAKIKTQPLVRTVSTIKENDYANGGDISFNDKDYVFFLNEKDRNPYPIYYQQYGQSKLLKEGKLPVNADNSQLTTWNKKKEARSATNAFKFNKTYKGDAILLASVSKQADKNHSVVTISEFDENMNARFSADYTISLLKWRPYTKTIVGKKYSDTYDDGHILDVVDDNLGYIYLLVQSANPEDGVDENLFWVYQFNKSDKSYRKVYRKEISGNIMPDQVKLSRSTGGKVFVITTGFEDDDNKKNDDKVSKYMIGGFGNNGVLEKIANQKLTMDMFQLFDAAIAGEKESNGYVRGLKLRNLFINNDGSYYLVWEQELKNTVMGNTNTHYYTYSANALVQYFNTAKKMTWQQPIYKMQVSEDIYPLSYSGIRSFHDGERLVMFYPDESGNANKDVTNRKVSTYTVSKFANKDLTGFFTLVFNDKGLEKRKYLSWTNDKPNFSLNVLSLNKINNRFIGVATKLKQGVFKFEELDYTLFSIEL